MSDRTSEKKTDLPSHIAQSWYIPPVPEVPRGWLVFSRDFVLAMLQGRAAEPHTVRRSPGWLIVGTIVVGIMALAQAILIILSRLPIISWFVELLARSFAGNAPGTFLRACYWKSRLKHLGQNTIIDQYVDIRGPAAISIGSYCHLDANVRLKGGERGYGQHGSIEIGNYVHLGPGVLIVGRGGVVIRDFASLSADARIYSASNTIELPHDPGQLISMSHVAPHDQQHIIEGPVLIDEYAFIGMMTCILPGVRVGRGAIVHANLELTRDVPPFANLGGLPRGRQIGWRRPRRTSPKLDRSAGASPETGADGDA